MTKASKPESAPDDAPLTQTTLQSLAGYQLRRADIAMRQAFARHIADAFDLRPVEFSVLVLLAENERVTHKQLSRALDVAPSNMVAVVARLRQRRLLARRPNPSDGRSIVLTLTREGGDLEARTRAAVLAMEDDMLCRWDAREHDQLLTLLQRFKP